MTKMAAGPAKAASAEEKKAFEARRQKFLDKVDSEMDAMSAASSDVQASLDETGGAAAFNKLRADFRAAQAALKANPKDAAAKAAITTVMTGVKKMLKPWLDAVDAERDTQLALLDAVGADPEAAPSSKSMKEVKRAVAKLAARLRGNPQAKVSKGDLRVVAKLAGKLGAPLPAVMTAEWADALVHAAEANPSYHLVSKLGASLLTDTTYLFGKQTKGKKTVTTTVVDRKGRPKGVTKKVPILVEDMAVEVPSMGQLLNRGFFSLTADPGDPEESKKELGQKMSKEFVKEMLKEGCDWAAAWGTPDTMHFELPIGWGPEAPKKATAR